MNELAFQDLIPDNHCYGCGPHNAHGLRIKSYWDVDNVHVIMTHTPNEPGLIQV